MRWSPGRRSTNLEDRRGLSGRGLGLGGTVILLILSLVFGKDFLSLAGGAIESSPQTSAPVEASPEEERLVDFVSFVLDSAQAHWARVLPEHGVPYREATLVLFRDAVQSACGSAQSATGPFYCPGDEKIYVDLGFYDELQTRFGAPGDFAQAYVLAHEIGHHVQHVLGLDRQVARARGGPGANEASVRLELQADCLAGIWGNRAARQNLLDPGDVEEGLAAAAAVGDDRITAGRVSPDAFTHGSSAQRSHWFKRGMSSGRIEDCDTFSNN
jgi:predicted metalloprotease